MLYSSPFPPYPYGRHYWPTYCPVLLKPRPLFDAPQAVDLLARGEGVMTPPVPTPLGALGRALRVKDGRRPGPEPRAPLLQREHGEDLLLEA